MTFRTIILAGAAAASVACVVSATPAWAVSDRHCNTTSDGLNSVCVAFDPAPQDGALVSGLVTGTASNISQNVYQCHIGGYGCVLYISGTGPQTTSKLASAGHDYRDCASFVNQYGGQIGQFCSPFVTVPLN